MATLWIGKGAVRSKTWLELDHAEKRGRDAFQRVSARMTEAMHAGKTLPPLPRNPFRHTDMRAAWTRGWNAMNAAWCAAMYGAEAA